MKHSKPAKKRQTFVWDHNADAKSVSLAGSFNNWFPTAMSRLNGRFQASVQLAPGEHQYKFLVDGEWQHDSAAKQSVPNEFGTLNSVIEVR